MTLFWFDPEQLKTYEVNVLRKSASSTRHDLMRVHDVGTPREHYYAVPEAWLKPTAIEAMCAREADLYAAKKSIREQLNRFAAVERDMIQALRQIHDYTIHKDT
jgi:hypothetical protein